MAESIESEVKLPVASADEGRRRLATAGARPVRPREFEDNVLLDDAESSLSRQSRILRLRRTEAGARLTFKAPRPDSEGVKRRLEIEVPAPEPDRLETLLEALGFRPWFRYQKYRETFSLCGTEVVLDETPIGCFFEVEGPLDAIHEAAAALGFEREDYVRESYLALFRATGLPGDMVFQ